MNKDEQARDAIEERKPAPAPKAGQNPEGPHAREALTDREKTPGTGSLPDDTAEGTAEGVPREADVGPD